MQYICYICPVLGVALTIHHHCQNTEECSDMKVDEVSESRSFRYVKKPGWLGSGISHLLLNIRDTTAMLGLSSGYGCTHNNAI